MNDRRDNGANVRLASSQDDVHLGRSVLDRNRGDRRAGTSFQFVEPSALSWIFPATLIVLGVPVAAPVPTTSWPLA